MESALKNYLYKKEPGKMPYLGIVHRLDQPVEGILVFAHTPFAAKELSRQISSGQMEKIYLAVTKEKPVQMAHAGMPLTGDRKYGGTTDTALGLCACSLTFLYPGSRKKMHFKVKPKGEAFRSFSL